MNKYIVLIIVCFLMSVNYGFAQVIKISDTTPSKLENYKRIEPSAHVARDSAVILLNNKFYRLSELREYNNTIDGVVIESLDVIRDKETITKIISDKISVLIIVNAPKGQRADSLKSQKKN